MERAAFTPSTAFTATVCPILIPGPKLVYVMPLGAMASSRARTTESLPGSQPAEITETALCFLAASPRHLRSSTMSVCMSKLSTVLIPISRRGNAFSLTFLVGVHRMATSTFPSSFTSFTTGIPSSSAGRFSSPCLLITPAISKSGETFSVSITYLPIFPYPTTAALIFSI